MTVFLIWIIIAIFVLGTYIYFLWRRNRFRSRFRIKLTILFLLFVLIPTVPLTFTIANLITQSADLLLIPGIGSALDTAIETIKIPVATGE